MPVPVAAYPAAGMGQVEASSAAAKAEVKAEEEELKIREKQMMRALVEERLAQLGGRGKKRLDSTIDISTGSDGVGKEREILHQLKNDTSTQTPNGETARKRLITPLRRRNAAIGSGGGGDDIPMERSGGPMAPPLPLPPPAIPVVPQAMGAAPPAPAPRRAPVLPPRPDRIVSSKFKLPRSNRKLKIKDLYAPKPLKKKHPRSWIQPLPSAKKRRHKYPYLVLSCCGRQAKEHPPIFYGSPESTL
jgi:hypothetical protein